MSTPVVSTPGVDIVEVQEVADSIARFGDRYLRRVFREEELAGLDGMSAARRDAHLAGRFAAKEAVFKAVRMPSDQGIGWTCIEIVRRPDGSPGVRLHGSARHWAHLNGVSQLEVSISHDGGRAMAVAIAQSVPAAAEGTLLHVPADAGDQN